MKKMIGFMCTIFFSLSLLGCGDSANNKFNTFVKKAIQDHKESIYLYDSKSDKVYYYVYGHQSDLEENSKDFLNQQFYQTAGLKNCSKNLDEIYNVSVSSDSLTFSCTFSMKDFMIDKGHLTQGAYDSLSDKQKSDLKDIQVNIKILGEHSNEIDFIDENGVYVLLAFNKKTIHIKGYDNYTFTIKNKAEIIDDLKTKCHITMDNTTTEYDDCMRKNSRVIVTSL